MQCNNYQLEFLGLVLGYSPDKLNIFYLLITNLRFQLKYGVRPLCKSRRCSCVDKRNGVKLSSKDIVATAQRANIPRVVLLPRGNPFCPFGLKRLISWAFQWDLFFAHFPTHIPITFLKIFFEYTVKPPPKTCIYIGSCLNIYLRW